MATLNEQHSLVSAMKDFLGKYKITFGQGTNTYKNISYLYNIAVNPDNTITEEDLVNALDAKMNEIFVALKPPVTEQLTGIFDLMQSYAELKRQLEDVQSYQTHISGMITVLRDLFQIKRFSKEDKKKLHDHIFKIVAIDETSLERQDTDAMRKAEITIAELCQKDTTKGTDVRTALATFSIIKYQVFKESAKNLKGEPRDLLESQKAQSTLYGLLNHLERLKAKATVSSHDSTDKIIKQQIKIKRKKFINNFIVYITKNLKEISECITIDNLKKVLHEQSSMSHTKTVDQMAKDVLRVMTEIEKEVDPLSIILTEVQHQFKPEQLYTSPKGARVQGKGYGDTYAQIRGEGVMPDPLRNVPETQVDVDDADDDTFGSGGPTKT